MLRDSDRFKPSPTDTLVLGAIVTAASHAVPYWVLRRYVQLEGGRWPHWVVTLSLRNTFDLVALAFALVLALSAPRRSGLRVGRVAAHWKAVLAVMLFQWALVAIVYPNLPIRPFGGGPIGMWAISPAAQEIVFTGYLYGLFALRWPQRLHPRVPIDVALLVTAFFFAAWHLVNLKTLTPGFVAFQLSYVFVLTCFSGMTRVLTGSVLYCVIIHTGVNFIAWMSR